MIYKLLIDPLLKSSHSRAASLAKQGEKVLDVACGIGTLSFMMADNGSIVSGIDLDQDKMKQAELTKKKRNATRVNFFLQDATSLSCFKEKEFDVAVISMAIHQFSPEDGLKVLKEMERVASKIIVLDYAYPMNASLYGWFTRIIEWIAGGEHNRNFKQYLKNGGIDSLLSKTGLHSKKRYLHGKGTLMVSFCEILSQG